MNAFELSHALTESVASLRPITATFMGLAEHDDRWDDLSPEGAAEFLAMLRRTRSDLDALAPSSDRWETLAADVLRDYCEVEAERIERLDHLADLNSLSSPFQLFRMALDVMDAARPDHARCVCARLESLPSALEGYRRLLAEGLARGVLVAARQVRAAVAQGRVTAASDGPLVGMRARIDPREHERFDRAIGPACAAFSTMTDWLEREYLPRAPSADGVGRARYVRAARRFLGTRIDPEETYAWGWRELASIRAEMVRVAEEMMPGVALDEVLRRMREDPAYAAPDVETFRIEMRERQRLAMDSLAGKHFDVPAPVRAIDVRLAARGGPPGAYYLSPSEDFSRPGTVWYSIAEDGPVARYDQISTAYHEGFPGHHLQVATQVFLRERLSRWHRVGEGWSGYAEGWALYAERLMGELGFYEHPSYTLGMLVNQLVRALRVVIDIGVHCELTIPPDAPFHPNARWRYDIAVEALADHGGLPRARAESEATRYFGWPGQAICYKVGERAMLTLRDEWRRRHGPDADLKDFHAAVLGCGSVALDRLHTLVLDA